MQKYQPNQAVENAKTTVNKEGLNKSNSRKNVVIDDSKSTIREFDSSGVVISPSEAGDNSFNLNQWAKDIIRYGFFLLFFSLLIFEGRGSDQIASYAAMWKMLLQNRTANTRYYS